MSTRHPCALRRVLALLLLLALGSCGLLGIDTVKKPLDVRYVDNRYFDDGDLDEILTRFFKDFEDSRFKKSAVDDAAFDIERAYLAAGHPHVRVEYTYEEPPDARPLAVFTIVEGLRVEFAGVKFEGATAFSRKELEAFFEPPATGLFEESASAYIEDSVKASANELELAYTTRGYIEARVEIERVEFDETGTRATVHIRIHEGPLCRITTLEIQGADPRIDARRIEAVRKDFIGKPYFERLTIEIQGRIEEACAQSGFGDVHATRTSRIVTSDGSVDLAFAIESGPRITVGKIHVEGNRATRPAFVRSRLALHTGELYSREKERTSFGRLYRSGVFDRVSIRSVVPEGEDLSSGSVTRDVRVDVSEGRAIETFIEPGYGSYEGARVAAGARHKNLFGTGRILDFRGVLAERAQRGELSLIDPWLFESDVIGDLSLFGNQRQEPSFDSVETGVGVTLTRRFSRVVEGSVGYKFRNSGATDVEVLDADAQEAIDHVDISSVESSYSYDSRDSVFQPTTGTYTKLGIEYASSLFGSDLDFVRYKAQQAAFVSLNSATVLGGSIEFGLIEPVAGTSSIPLQERFYNGGENSVRSFRESELGPKDEKGEPLGGEAFTTLSVELRRRLRGHLEGALFYDVGNVTPSYSDVLDFEGYGQAIGVGLRYTLPVGPIRVDGALNPNPGEFESRFVVHVSLGLSF